jgi:hypothetical protein
MFEQRTKTNQKNLAHLTRSSAPDKQLKRNLSTYTDILTFVLIEVDMPAQCRPFVDAVVGASEARSGWFECDDHELGKRLPSRNQEGFRKYDSVKKQAQRYRRLFEDWQIEAGFELIEIEHGGKSRDKKYKSRYKADKLLSAWEEAALLVELSVDRDRNPDGAKTGAAKKVSHKLIGTPISRSRGNKRRTDDLSLSISYLNTAITYFRKSLVQAKRSGFDPAHTLEEIGNKSQREYDDFMKRADDPDKGGLWWINEVEVD